MEVRTQKLAELTEVSWNAFEIAPVAVSLSTMKEGRFLMVNSLFCAISGYDAEELIGRSAVELGMWTDFEQRDSIRERLASGATVRNVEASFRDKGGVMHQGLFSVSALDVEGTPCILAAMHDTTEYHSTLNALRHSEDRLRAFARSVPDLTLIIDEDGRYVEVLAQVSKLDLLYSGTAEVEGRLMHEVIGGAKADELLAWIRRAIDTGETQVLEYQLDAPAGPRWFEGRASPLDIMENGKRMAVVVAQDITLRHEAQLQEEQLAERRRRFTEALIEAQEAERARVARELHDGLGQVLTALKLGCRGMLDTLEEGSPLRGSAEQLAEHLSVALETARRLARGLRPAVLDDLGLGPAIESLVSGMCGRNLEGRVSIDPEVGPLSRELSLALYRIAQEALTNVVRHAEARVVTVRLRRDAEALLLRIEDDGRGLAPGDMTATDSIGITGMRERAALVGAQLTLGAGADGGTFVEVRCFE